MAQDCWSCTILSLLAQTLRWLAFGLSCLWSSVNFEPCILFHSVPVSEKGADINSANVDGATALHDAVSRGDVAIVSELVRKGAKTTVKAKKG